MLTLDLIVVVCSTTATTIENVGGYDTLEDVWMIDQPVQLGNVFVVVVWMNERMGMIMIMIKEVCGVG